MTRPLLLLSFLWLSGRQLRAQAPASGAPGRPAQVGDIAFDARTDRADFFLCDSGRIYQYYQVGTQAEGEHRAVLTYFTQHYRPTAAFGAETGWLVIRFVVNCRGETDRFRVRCLGPDYRPRTFRPELVAQLLQLTRDLRGWQQGPRSGLANSYMYLNFILKNGQLVDIGP